MSLAAIDWLARGSWDLHTRLTGLYWSLGQSLSYWKRVRRQHLVHITGSTRSRNCYLQTCCVTHLASSAGVMHHRPANISTILFTSIKSDSNAETPSGVGTSGTFRHIMIDSSRVMIYSYRLPFIPVEHRWHFFYEDKHMCLECMQNQ